MSLKNYVVEVAPADIVRLHILSNEPFGVSELRASTLKLKGFPLYCYMKAHSAEDAVTVAKVEYTLDVKGSRDKEPAILSVRCLDE